MRKLIAITDLTRMQGHRVCVGGYMPGDVPVRPVLKVGGLTEDWLHLDQQQVICPFEVVELELREHVPHPPHTEDWLIEPEYRVLRGALTPERRKAMLQRIDDGAVEHIFGAAIHHEDGHYVVAGEGVRSLGAIQPDHISQVAFRPHDHGKWDYRISFVDKADQWYRLSVSDLAFRSYLNHLHLVNRWSPEQISQRLTSTLKQAEVYLRVGLARGWQKHPDRCYLQITGVYSFPDYLQGRCFADFAAVAVDLGRVRSDDDLPF